MSFFDDDPAATATTEFNVLPSVLDGLREARARIGAGAKPLDLEIPGYRGAFGPDTGLVARFEWKSAKELAASAKSLAAIKDPLEQRIASSADALHVCNEEILIRDGDRLESLQHGGEPVTFRSGEGLAVSLGMPKPSSARECVRAVIGNEYTIMDMAEALGFWLSGVTPEVAEEHLGE